MFDLSQRFLAALFKSLPGACRQVNIPSMHTEALAQYMCRNRTRPGTPAATLKTSVRRVLPGFLLVLWASTCAAAETELEQCLAQSGIRQIARVLDPQGNVVYAQVLEQRNGHITQAVTIADADTALAEVFDRPPGDSVNAFPVSDDRVCAVVDLPQPDLDQEKKVIISTGLNFAAHAEEAGGGDVFLFPKPAAPTRPYSRVSAPAGVLLFDYEVELAYVLLKDIDLATPISRQALLANSAFFLSNDFSDREAIIRNASISGPGTGFVEGKGQPGFMPAGPWMVRGTELFEAVEACGADGLGLQLSVDGGGGPILRQSASTALMIIKPAALIGYIAEWIKAHGPRTAMPFKRDGVEVFYPLAIGDDKPTLPAGSIVQTGTPAGVALHAPDGALGLVFRGILQLRNPFAQFLAEERARFSEEDTAYLKPGDRVFAKIDGLGAQVLEIAAAGLELAPDPCSTATK